LLLIPLFIIGHSMAYAYIYKYTDKNGVVSFTNKRAYVPQARAHTVEVIDERTLPPLVTIPEAAAVEPHKAKSPFRYWINQPLSKTSVVLGVLVALIFFIIRIGGGGIFLRLTAKLFFIAFIGASVYSIYTAREYSSISSVSEEPGSPRLKRISPIERAEDAATALENRMDEQEETLNTVTQPDDH
jgi:hypothetical protein